MTEPTTPRTSSRNLWLAAILITAAVGLYLGWKLFWFMTDDAMIAFRYVSNSILGYGYVWNPPPFKAVEGYTSFLWIILLEVIWRWFGIEPPQIANTIALLFSYATLFLSVRMFMRVSLKEHLEKYRLPLLALALLGILTNRTFLAWTSSGLETALFNFCFTLWIFIAVFSRRREGLWLFGLTAAAALAHLTRPDGLLIMLSTAVLVAYRLIELKQAGRLNVGKIVAIAPVVVPVIHLLWRHSFYGEWLPNTYYAKYLAAWPAAGFRYLASFILEYGLWFWILGLGWMVVWWYRQQPHGLQAQRTQAVAGLRGLIPSASIENTQRFALIVVLGTVAAHIGYYTLLIGGDHFEYRVYSYLVPLIFLSSLWLLNRLVTDGIVAVCLLALFVALSWPIQWTHWLVTKDYTTRDDTWIMRIPVAPQFPAPVRWYAEAFDDLQFWLIEHHVCMRHQEHKVFYEFMAARLPARSLNVPQLAGEHPIAAFQSVGIAGWVFPKVAILDAFGLNDYVIARNPERPRHMRYMAHDRMPPQGYLESFSLNYGLLGDQSAGFIRREYEISTDEIKETELFWIDRIVHGNQQPFTYSMLNRIGESLMRTDKQDSAMVFLRQARSLDSSQARAYVNLGLVFGHKRLSDSSLYYLQRAVAIDPDNPVVLGHLGRTFATEGYDQFGIDRNRAEGAFADAEKCLDRTLQIDPEQAEAMVELASIYLFLDHIDSSKAYLSSVEAVHNPPPEELRLLGDRYLFRKQRDLAMRAYRLAIKNGLRASTANALIREYDELSDLRAPRPEGL
jgi:arabinofuranosyltransferase